MPNVGPLTIGAPPPGWRVVLECSVTPAGNVAWSILPDVASGMTAAQARLMAESLHAFLRTLVRS